MLVWLEKVAYDARYVPDDNLFHRALEILHILSLATVVVHIRPVQIMADPSNTTTLSFCLALLVQALLSIHRQWDIYKNVIGGPEAKANAAHDMRRRGLTAVFYTIASVLALKNYVFADADDLEEKHVPVLLCTWGYVGEQIFNILTTFVFAPKDRSHKEFFVPMNLDFTLHRLGEWTMLMLGESVLALLIVEPCSTRRYYVSFYCGISTVTAFQYLFFRSQPFEADDHAMRRSPSGGYMFSYSATLYSASLIMVGCSYKMILHHFLEEEEEGGEKNEQEVRDIANLFSYSSALSFLSLDLMLMSHRGFLTNLARLRPNGRCALMPSLVSAVDWGLTVALASLSSFVSSLELLTMCGLLIVLFQVILRTRGMRYFPVSKKALQDDRPWPNRTQPQIAPRET